MHGLIRLQQVSRYRTPGYPTQYVLNTHPELLRFVPTRWKRSPVVMTALAGVCVILAGCDANRGGTCEGFLLG